MSIIKLPGGILNVINGLLASKYALRVESFELSHGGDWEILITLGDGDITNNMEDLSRISHDKFQALVIGWEKEWGDPDRLRVSCANAYKSENLNTRGDYEPKLLINIPSSMVHAVGRCRAFWEECIGDFRSLLLKVLREEQLKKGK